MATADRPGVEEEAAPGGAGGPPAEEAGAASPGGEPSGRGAVTFSVIWFGQLVSAFGSGLTAFALGVWVYQATGSATQFALIRFSSVVPSLLLLPLVGALVDRWDRRWVMIWSDSGAALSTLGLVALLWHGGLQVWQIYLLVAVSALFQAFQWPAFAASISLLVPKRQLGRAGGMTQLGTAVAQILAPTAAGALMAVIPVHGVMLVDLVTFLFAVLTLLVVRIPRPRLEPASTGTSRPSLRQAATDGWHYIRRRKGLFGLLLMLAGYNFAAGMLEVLITPLVLSFADARTLGLVLSVASAGFAVGGVLMILWGGPENRMTAIYSMLALQGTILLVGGLRESAVLVAASAFGFMLGLPIANACNQAIWQSKVTTDLQGRVFAIRQMIALSSLPLGQLVAGPLAEYLFEPLLLADGPLAATAGRLFGVGPGRGTGLLFSALGLLVLVVVLAGYRYPRLRNLEREIPDVVEGEGDAIPAPQGEAQPASMR